MIPMLKNVFVQKLLIGGYYTMLVQYKYFQKMNSLIGDRASALHK